jgi:hypothetical protein
MDIILQTVIQYAAELIALILVSALGILGAWIMNKINKNKNLQNIEAATSTVIHAAQDTVLMLQQMYVDDYNLSIITLHKNGNNGIEKYGHDDYFTKVIDILKEAKLITNQLKLNYALS